MNDFLFDISVQELPYKFIPTTIGTLKSLFEKLFEENSVKYDSLEVYGSPRHLVVYATSLQKNTDDKTIQIKGPILNIAINEEGEYTKAAMGFAKKNNISTSDLFQKDGYIWANIIEKSKSIIEILEDNLSKIIYSIQGAHFMRWEDRNDKFSRPVEHVLALFNDKILNIELFGIKANNKTSGHRFSKNPVLEINYIEKYFDSMKENFVFIKQNERKELIKNLSIEKANEENLHIKFENLDELLEELTYITEYPNPVICEFGKEYLDVPDIVTTTVMTKHQRYIPLYELDGKLSNKFIAVSNYIKNSDFENIINGNQRVVKARLEDGLFFFREDTKEPFELKINKLSGITFQKNLGTVLDKTNRIINLSEYIAEELNLDENTIKNIKRAAKLAKADLATELVFEFTELQGYIGEVYANKSGENSQVSCAIKEHYFPLGSDSELAETITGQVVGIADKIDTICAVFLGTQGELKKKRPTGSNDPLGIRRAVVGVIRTIFEKNLNINLKMLIIKSMKLISENFNIQVSKETQSEIEAFILSRLSVMLQTEYSKDVIDSTINFALDDISNIKNRLNYVAKIKELNDFCSIQDNFVRIARLIKDKNILDKIDENLFEYDEEKILNDFIVNFNYKDIDKVEELSSIIAEFFDKVLVMSENIQIKNNRLSLLWKTYDKISKIADFSKLIP